jgi:hypothetical protein
MLVVSLLLGGARGQSTVATDEASELEEVRLESDLSAESGCGLAMDISTYNNNNEVVKRPEGGSRSGRLA